MLKRQNLKRATFEPKVSLKVSDHLGQHLTEVCEYVCVCVGLCVCACVRERERDSESSECERGRW